MPLQEHNTMSPTRTRTQTTRFGVEQTYHEASAPPQEKRKSLDVYELHVTALIVKHCLFPVHNCLYALRRFMDYNSEVGFIFVLAGG